MKKPSVRIEAVDNGYVVKVLNCGLSEFKEPYSGNKPIVVFEEFSDLMLYLGNLFGRYPGPQEEKHD